MGIFDDAIRQHLDLKRRQGADEDELKQLEDEAFGPPARPGDPDFPETGESAVEAEEPAKPEATAGRDEAVAEAPAADPDAPVEEPSDEAAPHGDALLADPSAEPAAPPAEDRPVEDTAAQGFTTAEREAIADQPTEFFDQAPEPLELGELDLDLKDELDEPEGEEELLRDEEAEDAEVAEAPAPDPTPVDEMRVVEETEPASETDLEAEPEEASAEDAEVSEPPAEEGEEEAEDVLEETPEFLRDNPDDDELWFEQGEPKDFDF